MMEKKREGRIGVCKEIAILLVVLDHSFRDEMVTKDICYFINDCNVICWA